MILSKVEFGISLTFLIAKYLQDIGLPFYGRSFAGATGLNQAHSGADQIAWGIDDGKQQCLCNIHFTAKAISCVLHAPSLKELHNISISSPNFHT